MTLQLDLQIDTLTLYGVSRFSASQLRAAIEEELRLLLENKGIPRALRSGTRSALRVDPIQIPRHPTLQQTSAAIASTIYESLAVPPKNKPHPGELE
jgi:hypothetical protein